jgi:hypothetical protein
MDSIFSYIVFIFDLFHSKNLRWHDGMADHVVPILAPDFENRPRGVFQERSPGKGWNCETPKRGSDRTESFL